MVATIAQVKTRIEAIAATMAGMKTPKLNSIGVLTPAMLYALDVKPMVAVRERQRLGNANYLLRRDYELTLFVREVKPSATNADAEMQVAIEHAYEVAETLPALFMAKPQLELSGNDGIAYSTLPIRDTQIGIVSYGNDSSMQFAAIQYVLSVVVQAP